MAINFPDSPTVNQTYAVGDRTWKWTGATWDALGQPAVPTTNAIINGAFDIAQRGASIANPATGSYLLDRWRLYYDGSGATRTISQQTHTPGAAPTAGQERPYFLRWAQTVAGSGGSYNVIQQPIEDVRTFAGQTITLSFYAKASSAINLPTINLVQGFGSGGSAQVVTLVAYNHPITTSWARYTFTITLPSISGKTIGAGNALILEIAMPYDTTFTFDFDGVQLEAGSVATPFKRNAPSIQAELAACQRYYVRYSGAAYNTIGGRGNAKSTTQAAIWFTHPVTMRVGPNAIDYSTLAVWGEDTAPAVTTAAIDINNPQTTAVTMTVASGLTQYRNYGCVAFSTGPGYIGFSSEL